MPTALLAVTIALIGIAVILLFAWLIPFNILVRVIRRKHRRYYDKLGRPYRQLAFTGIRQRDDKAKSRKRLVWYRCLVQVYDGVPRSFLNDSTCQRLARNSRSAMRLFVFYAVIMIFFGLPAGGFTIVLSRHTDAAITDAGGPDVKISGEKTTDNSSTSTSNTQTTSSFSGQTSVSTGHRSTTAIDNSSVIASGTPKTTYTFTTLPPSQATPLTRDDLMNAFATVAPLGQKKADKISVCKQLITQAPPASDLGPSGGGDICTDANLSTYSTY